MPPHPHPRPKGRGYMKIFLKPVRSVRVRLSFEALPSPVIPSCIHTIHLPAREPARSKTIRLALLFDCMQLGPELHSYNSSASQGTGPKQDYPAGITFRLNATWYQEDRALECSSFVARGFIPGFPG